MRLVTNATAGLVHAARGHALVGPFGDDGNAVGLSTWSRQAAISAGHLLLNLQPPRN